MFKSLGLFAILSNTEKFPNSDLYSKLAPILIEEMKEELEGPDSWVLNNFALILEFFKSKIIIPKKDLESIGKFFDVFKINKIVCSIFF